MKIERNGVVFLSADEDQKKHTAFRELSKVSLGDVKLQWGFFLVDEGGKTIVVPASEEDRRKMILKAFPDTPEEAFRSYCVASNGGCVGNCAGQQPRRKCMFAG